MTGSKSSEKSKKKPERFFVIYVVMRVWQGIQRIEIDPGTTVTYTGDGSYHEKVLFATISPTRAKLRLQAMQSKLNYREPFYIRMLRYTPETLPESFTAILAGDLEFANGT